MIKFGNQTFKKYEQEKKREGKAMKNYPKIIFMMKKQYPA